MPLADAKVPATFTSRLCKCVPVEGRYDMSYLIATFTEILTRIKEGSLLPPAVIAAYDHDTILDERDNDVDFEAQWMRCHNEIEERWRPGEVKPELIALIGDICRESFLAVSRATGQHEIAAYISDDFDLIVRGAVLELKNDFLTNLWLAYNRNEIPTSQTSK